MSNKNGGRNKTASEKLLEKALIQSQRRDGTINETKLNHLNTLKLAYNDLLDGATRSMIEANITNGKYGRVYKKASVKNICAELYDMIKLDFQTERPIMKEKLYTMLLDVYTDAKQNGDRTNALKAISEIAKITGAYEETQSKKASVSLKSGDNEITIDFNLMSQGNTETDDYTDVEYIEDES